MKYSYPNRPLRESIKHYISLVAKKMFTRSEINFMSDEEWQLYNNLITMGLRQTCQIIAALPIDRMGPNE